MTTTHKHPLLELPVDDILLLVQKLPGLSEVVARECKLPVATLMSGGRRASQSLQTQLARRPAAIASLWNAYTRWPEQEEDEAVVAFLGLVIRELPEHLADLVLREFRLERPASPSGVDQESSPAVEGEDRRPQSREELAGAFHEVTSLLSEARALEGPLRIAVEDVAAGRHSNFDWTVVADWCARTWAALKQSPDDVADLGRLQEWLTKVTEELRQQDEVQKLIELRRAAVDVESGVGRRWALDILRQHGFADLEALDAAIAQQLGAASSIDIVSRPELVAPAEHEPVAISEQEPKRELMVAAHQEPEHEPESVLVVEQEPMAAAEPEPKPAIEHEPVAAAEPELVVEQEPAAAEPEPKPAIEHEPVAAAEPELVVEQEPAAAEPEPKPAIEHEPVAAAEPQPAPVVEPEPAAVAERELVADEHQPVTAAEPVAEPESVLAAKRESVAGPASAAEPNLVQEEQESAPAAAPPWRQVSVPANPWETGSPPLLAYLISRGQEALAYQVANSAHTTECRLGLLRFLVAAFNLDSESLALQLPDLLVTGEEDKELTADEAQVFLSALMRAGLALGYLPLGPVDDLLVRAGMVETAEGKLVREAADAVLMTGYRHDSSVGILELSELPASWVARAQDAARLRSRLAGSRTNFQRASKVIHHLVGEGQPLGDILSLLEELAQGGSKATSDARWGLVEVNYRAWGDGDHRRALLSSADRSVSSRQQLRKEIVGPARDAIENAILDVRALMAEMLELQRRTHAASLRGGADVLHDFSASLAAAVTGATEPATVGHAAMSRLVSWLSTPQDGVLPSGEVDELLQRCLLPLYELPRDRKGRPHRSPTAAELGVLIAGRDADEAVRGHIEAGNFAAVVELLATVSDGTRAGFEERVQVGTANAKARVASARAEVERLAARLRSLFHEEDARQILADPALVEPGDDSGRFDLTLQALGLLETQANNALGAARQGLRERASTVRQVEDRARIDGLLEVGDEALAAEFLAMLEVGQELPRIEPPPGDDFCTFFPAVVDVAIRNPGPGRLQAVRSFARKRVGPQDLPDNRILREGATAWRNLEKEKRGASFAVNLAQVLRLIGLIPRSDNWFRESGVAKRAGYATVTVNATPLGRSYIPSLGTQANGIYQVTLVWDSSTPQRLLELIPAQKRMSANIILYFGVLTPAQRSDLRRLSGRGRGTGLSPLVVDEAVAGWLSAQAEPGWKLTQRVTLPFTTLNPYTPFAGGAVPDEVFVGREHEQSQIVDPTGSMFVYGGRQLGKSALLRKVQRTFTDPSPVAPAKELAPRTGMVVLYLDLQANGIGTMREPADTWSVIAEHLQDEQVIPRSERQHWSAKRIADIVRTWLAADPSNRLLLLLDEADNFLTADAGARASDGTGAFPVLQELKGLMESTDRRFKPVFAGLHQVQRFHDLENTPVAHGGADILVGPLQPSDARELVRDPMLALGYEFESEEAIWRLLLATNYQASLVQIVCEALVKHVQRRSISPQGNRVKISAQDVVDVTTSQEVRELIAQRFRWTINLDPRYRVIALVVAFLSLDAGPGEPFQATDLHEECALYWANGFSRSQMSSQDFERYLVELTGLGVLVRHAGGYLLRSPSVISLLGDRASLERELEEADSTLELPYRYNPVVHRRPLRGHGEPWQPRSPITDAEIVRATSDLVTGGGGLAVVFGSEANGIRRVSNVFQQVSVDQGWKFDRYTASRDLRISRSEVRRHVVIDALDGTLDAESVLRLQEESRRPGLSVTVVMGSDAADTIDSLVSRVPVLTLHRWTIEGLGAWHESPFDTRELRRRLHRVTSGWPTLVEEAMRRSHQGAADKQVLDDIVASLRQTTGRDLIRAAGIDVAAAEQWASWSQLGDDGLFEGVPLTIADLMDLLPGDAAEVVGRFELLDAAQETEQGWVLDRAIVETLRPQD